MATDYIAIQRSVSTAVHAGKLINAIAQLRAAKVALDEVRAIGNHCFDGGDFSVFETLFGVPTGKGNTVFDLVNGTAGAMEGIFQNTNAVDLVARVG